MVSWVFFFFLRVFGQKGVENEFLIQRTILKISGDASSATTGDASSTTIGDVSANSSCFFKKM